MVRHRDAGELLIGRWIVGYRFERMIEEVGGLIEGWVIRIAGWTGCSKGGNGEEYGKNGREDGDEPRR
jgi:hypothetical protein